MAPIVIFVFRRPEHLRHTLLSLMRCPGFDSSPVIVYGDGPRNEAESAEVERARRVAKSMLGERAEYRFSNTNLGLSTSIIRGVSEVLTRFDRIIVVEDDLYLEPGFLSFMNAGLDQYADSQDIYQISGYQFAVPEFAARSDALFLPFSVSWGWATWRRAWIKFDSRATGWERLKSDRRFRRDFNLCGVYDYATMIVGQMIGLRDSWAIRWYWTVFSNRGLVLFPPVSLVGNTGLDGSGTHGRGRARSFDAQCEQRVAGDCTIPSVASVVPENFAVVRKAIWKMNGRWLGGIVDRIRWYRTAFRAFQRS